MNMGVGIIIPMIGFFVLLLFVNPSPSYAQFFFSIDESNDYLIIGNDMIMATAAVGSGLELGSNNAPVPATGLNGCIPTLLNTVAAFPAGALIPGSGRTNDGNVAITDPFGTFSFAGIGVYADPDIGIRVAAEFADDADDGSSGSFFNDPVDDGTGYEHQGYPNSYPTDSTAARPSP